SVSRYPRRRTRRARDRWLAAWRMVGSSESRLGKITQRARAEHQFDGAPIRSPPGDLVVEHPPPRRRQVVVARDAIVLRGAPVGRHPAALLVSVQGGIERPLPDLKASARQLLDPVGNSPPV